MGIDSIIANNAAPAASGAKGDKAMGKDDFLRLMMMQMKNQDPLDPMDNQAMLSQMAQFTSLEQMTNLNDTTAAAQRQQGLMQATSLLGKQVEVVNVSDLNAEDGVVNGVSTVTSVRFTSEGAQLTLSSGHVATMDQVVRVSDQPENLQ